MSTKTLRCGYFVYAPGIYKDPNTGTLSGIYIDTMQSITPRLGLKLEWTKEVGFTTMVEELNNGQYDAVCASIWPNASRAPFVVYSTPLFYSGIGVYVRRGSKITSISDISKPAVRIATVEGEMTDIIARQQFPSAQRVTLPQFSEVSQVLLQLEQDKADVTFVEPFQANQFMASSSKPVYGEQRTDF
jgi:ABC-type amino acid transport substrate-binding protein